MEWEDTLRKPVIFNIITIVAMLISIISLIQSGQRLQSETHGALGALEAAVDDSNPALGEAVAALKSTQEERQGLYTMALLTMAIAIAASVIANYLGRSRHWTNMARIRELEKEVESLGGQ